MIIRYIVFDTETPNWHNDRMCSVGICVVEDFSITHQRYELVDPEVSFDAFNIQLHGIFPELVAGKPIFSALWAELRPLFESGILVAHNAPFDMAVLAKCLKHYQISWQPFVRYACTCQMGRACLPDAPNHKLDTLCRRLHIELDHHNAASDALACAKLLLYYLECGLDINRFLRTYDLTRAATHRQR